jgi:hypothetical protein
MRISPLQMYENDDISGLVTKSHLGYRYGIEPQQASKVATMIHQANAGATVSAYLNKFPVLELESDEAFTWDLIGNGKKNIPLIKASLSSNGTAVAATDKVGKNFTEFYLTFPEAYFTDVNQIVGERNEVYPILILDEPRAVGLYWEYRCRLNTGDSELFLPYDEVLEGKRFSKDFSPVEDTMSKKGGGVHYNFPFKMMNNFTMIRMEDTVPGNMIKRPVKFSWVDPFSKRIMTTWMDYRTYEFEMQYQDEVAKMLMYSTSNKTAEGNYVIKGKSGNVVKMGAGIRQQMESSNYFGYSDFNIEKFTEMLLDLSVGKIVMGQREVTVLTGEWGMYQFSKALEYHSTLYTPNRTESRIGMGSDGKMSYKGQFLDYTGPNGIKVNIMHDALKDDFERNKLFMPGKPGLAESYVYDILNMGTGDGKPNIQKVFLKGGGDIRGFQPGLRDPFTTDNKINRIMSTAVDGWTEHRAFTGGAIIYDPTRTATYKPNILSGIA